tara:strand:- start:11825 stop:12415 length:591 start_codon:yes stop_codon:yes gene_type:complete
MSNNLVSTFYDLQPQAILDCIEDLGQAPTGQVYQLNSYENRVYDIFLESGERWVAKFYRPHRWSAESIEEEHDFCWELKESGFPVIAPFKFDGETRLQWNGLHVAIFPRKAGRNPDELLTKDYREIGSKLALLHNIGARKKAKHRLYISTADYLENSEALLENFIAPEMKRRYWQAVNALADAADDLLADCNYLRI